METSFKPTHLLDLERFGPEAEGSDVPTLPQAQAYCRQLARRHYENFTVVSWLLPASLRQHFCNIYAYCRWADDLADETADPRASLELLAWWRNQLEACYQGHVQHPVFVALAETIRCYSIPPEPFQDLLAAFERDQRQTRYATIEELLDYCRCSANPVGRLVLILGGSHRDDCLALSDSVCTGLQLANFCQDVARDWHTGRIYLPLETCREHGYGEEDFHNETYNAAFRDVLRTEVDRAESFLEAGWPLVERLPKELRFQIGLFIGGGLAIVEAIRRQNYNVWLKRPTLSRSGKLRVAWQAWRRLRRKPQ
jgi:squalene synthase HpnC